MFSGYKHKKTGFCLLCGTPTEWTYCSALCGERYRSSLKPRKGQRKPKAAGDRLASLPRHSQAWYAAKIEEIGQRNERETGTPIDPVRDIRLPRRGSIRCWKV